MKTLYKILRRASSLMIGAVFFLAGTFKLMDPVGTGLIVEEYFKFLHLEFLRPVSLATGCSMALFETILGSAILTGVWRRIIACISGGTIAFFTLLTFVLWLKNPVMDCGCFGEVIHLTHLQTLVKNLILCALWAISYLPFRFMESPKKIKYVTFPLSCVISTLFMVYSLYYIPLMDFTPFRPGVQMGEDSRYNQVPLYFRDYAGEYYDEQDYGEGDVLLVSFYEPEAVKVQEALDRIPTAGEFGFKTYVLVNKPLGNVLDTQVFVADRKDLLSLNRSNGGYTLLHDGYIVRKWSAHNVPGRDEFKKVYEADSLEDMLKFATGGILTFEGYLLLSFALMLLL